MCSTSLVSKTLIALYWILRKILWKQYGSEDGTISLPLLSSNHLSLYRYVLLLFPRCFNLYSNSVYFSSFLYLNPFLQSFAITSPPFPVSITVLFFLTFSFTTLISFCLSQFLPLSRHLTPSNSPVGQSGRIKSKVLHPPNELIRPWRDEKRGEKNIKKVVMGLYWRRWVRGFHSI